jgi:hypothetical protein
MWNCGAGGLLLHPQIITWQQYKQLAREKKKAKKKKQSKAL